MAIVSIGYYHADEQYQIIEYAGLKLGTHQPIEVAWEYGHCLRSGFLPFIAFSALSFLKFLTVTDPFVQTIILRLITAILFFIAMNKTFNCFADEYSKTKSYYLFIILSFTLWFSFFLGVRFSSETWSAIFFAFGFSLLYSNRKFLTKSTCIFSGILLGISFLCRYQSVILIFFFLLWMLLFAKPERRNLLSICAGLTGALFIGCSIDCWFYNSVQFPFKNYLLMAVTGQGPDFGNKPFWFYTTEIFTKGSFLFGGLILTGMMFLVMRPKNVVAWIVIPFFLIHHFFGYKELRFLFPLLLFAPYLIAHFFMMLEQRNLLHNTILYSFIFLLSLSSCFCTFIAMNVPANQGVATIKFISRNYHSTKPVLLHTSFNNPYNPFESIKLGFYKNQNISFNKIKVIEEAFLKNDTINTLLLTCRLSEYKTLKRKLRAQGFEEKFQSSPQWALDLILNCIIEPKDIYILLEKNS